VTGAEGRTMQPSDRQVPGNVQEEVLERFAVSYQVSKFQADTFSCNRIQATFRCHDVQELNVL